MKKNSIKKVIVFITFISILVSLYIYREDNRVEKTMIQHYTKAYNTFTSWDWLVDPSTNLAVGMIKDGALKDYQHKIHPLDINNPNIWAQGEYYCDPDSIILAYNNKGKYNAQYLPYLNWDKDYFIQNDGKLGRFSVMYNPNKGNKYFNKTEPLQLEIREDHTIKSGKSYIETTVEIKNLYEEEINLLYIYQDAAYMWLPDENQENVGTYVGGLQTKEVDFFRFERNEPQHIVGTYHKKQNIFGGLYTSNPNAYVGVIPEYAYFKEHEYIQEMIDIGIYGYAELDYKKTADELFDYLSQWNGQSISKDDLKNRIIIFPIYNLKKGESRVINFYRLGYMDLNSKQSNQDWINNIEKFVEIE